MGTYNSYTGQNGRGYTRAQSASLSRSNEIKRKRKEDERAFLRSQAEAGREGALNLKRESNAGQMARQKLTGSQEREAATTKSIRAANAQSIKRGHEKSMGEINQQNKLDLIGAGNTNKFASLFPGSEDTTSFGATARDQLEGNGQDQTFAQFAEKPPEEQRKYMAYMKKNDPDKYLSYAKQYKMYAAPERETYGTQEEDTNNTYGGGAYSSPIYQSKGGTYTNY